MTRPQIRLAAISAAVASLLAPAVSALSAGVSVRSISPVALQSSGSAAVVFVVTNSGKEKVSGDISLTCDGGAVTPASVPADLAPRDWRVITAKVSTSASAASAKVTCRLDGASASADVVPGLDLSTLTWKRTFTADNASDAGLASPDVDDSTWETFRAPSIWERVGLAWCRVSFVAPESWKGRDLRLVMGAVDDADVTYLNGVEIGRTDSWDARREYKIPDSAVRWGSRNVLTVMVRNTNAGGGITKTPIMILPAGLPGRADAVQQPPINRPAPGKVGNPLPLRRMHVQDGVLRYPNGEEVALWGTNYYPQSWYQFDNMMKLKLDMKAVIRKDMDHMQAMGIEAIRIHVFDREVTDGDGNLKRNIHLDLLDYIVSECNKRGLYVYFTPIGWWAGPNEQPGAFSQVTSKPGMMFVPKAREAEANYLRNFLNHANPYTGHALKDEPSFCFMEIMNEPAYFNYSDLTGQAYPPQGELQAVLDRDRETFRRLWAEWRSARGLDDTPEIFRAFRYDLMRGYVRQMISAIRSTGASQPIAVNYGTNGDELLQAICDSECDAITMSIYPGGLTKISDGVNMLPSIKPVYDNGRIGLPWYDAAFDGRLDGKARVAYEFDADGASTACYLYPAIAAMFRNGELQIACQFQYDSYANAEWNTDWGTHWLNWLYTPSKSASFMIAKEAFHKLPRGMAMKQGTDQLIVGPMASSFAHNQSMLVTPDLVMHARTLSDWKPLSLPKSPSTIVGTGSSPYVDYGGTGVYKLEPAGNGALKLSINPDARLVGNCMSGSYGTSVSVLEQNRHWFRLRLPGWENARCLRNGKALTKVDGGWVVAPGEYLIRR